MNSFAGIFQEHTIKPEKPEHGTPAEERNTTGTPEHGTPAERRNNTGTRNNGSPEHGTLAERKVQRRNNGTPPEHPQNDANTAE